MKISKLALIALLGGALMAFGCSDDPAPEGMGGSGGSGGSGGASGFVCNESPPAPPTLEDACAAITPSLENPGSCTTTADAVDHQLTQLITEKSVDGGFNLDNKNTTLEGTMLVDTSCTQGSLATDPDGANGVDNELALLGDLIPGAGLAGLDEILGAALCVDPPGTSDLALRLAVNAAASCANVQLVFDGNVFQVCDAGDNAGDACMTSADCSNGTCADLTVPLNFVDGCLSGRLGRLPLSFPGDPDPVELVLDNVTLTASASQTEGFNGLIGATVADESAAAIANALAPGTGALVLTVSDILQSLENTPTVECDSISLAIQLGGVAETAGTGGSGGTGGSRR